MSTTGSDVRGDSAHRHGSDVTWRPGRKSTARCPPPAQTRRERTWEVCRRGPASAPSSWAPPWAGRWSPAPGACSPSTSWTVRHPERRRPRSPRRARWQQLWQVLCRSRSASVGESNRSSRRPGSTSPPPQPSWDPRRHCWATSPAPGCPCRRRAWSRAGGSPGLASATGPESPRREGGWSRGHCCDTKGWFWRGCLFK